VDIPVQYWQSIIGIELAVTGALLFQVRYFETGERELDGRDLPDPRIRLLVAAIPAATLFGSLDAILNGGGRPTAIAVAIGVALSVLPILLRVLPPLVHEARPDAQRSYPALTIIGLGVYVVAVAGLVVVLNR
jgi:hypothetical protein